MRTNRPSELPEPIQPSSSGGWPLPPPPPTPPPMRGTMYGPAITGTMRVDERSAEVLRALRAPAMPRAAPRVAPMAPPRTSRLAIAGLVLAVPASPVGLVLSAVALGNILAGRWRCKGEHLALAGVVIAVLTMTALLALVVG